MVNSTYLLPVQETISASWSKVHGSKKTFWAVIGLSILIAIGIGVLSGIVGSFSSSLSALVSIIGQLVNTLIQMSLLYIGIQRAKNMPIYYKQMFYTFDFSIAIQIVCVYVLQFLIFLPLVLLFVFIPFLILGAGINNTFTSGLNATNFLLTSWALIGVITAIYLSIRMMLCMGFVLDKNANAWLAIKMSFAATRHNELRLFGIFLFQIFIIVMGTLLLGIGLIWTLPFAILIYGMTYTNLLNNTNV